MIKNALPLWLPLALISGNASAQTFNYPVGSAVDNFITLDTDGIFHTLYDYTAAGKTVVLDFFFYDCVPCQQYAPSFSELFEAYGCNQGGIICFHVNAGIDSEALADQFSEDFGGDFAHPPTITPFNGGLLTDQFGVVSFPTLCVIAPDNTMWNDNVWPVDLETLQQNFPEGTNIQPMSCTVAVDEKQSTTAMYSAAWNRDRLVIAMQLPRASRVHAEVIDAMGRTINTTDLGLIEAGRSEHALSGDIANGSYLVRLSTSGSTLAMLRLIR